MVDKMRNNRKIFTDNKKRSEYETVKFDKL